jgi:diadenosine tetraphosphate (Ap4A) HIT family hydrolase
VAADPTPRRTGRVDIEGYIEALQAQNRRGECFICELAADPRGRHVVFEDDLAICFLPQHLTMPGRVLLAPKQHRTEVVDDFDEGEYLELQRRVHRVGRALSTAFATERLYVFSFGARDGVAHVHWHVAALPPGVPFMQQQFHAVMIEHGHLELSDAEKDTIVERIRAALDAHGARSTRPSQM